MKNKFTLYHTKLLKLYGFLFVSTIFICITMYLFLLLLVFLNIQNTKYIKIILIIFFIIIFLISHQMVLKKSSKKLLIEIENKNITIDNNIILFENIESIYMQGILLRNYPKFIIKTKDNKKYKFRLNKGDADFYDFEYEIRKYIKEFESKDLE